MPAAVDIPDDLDLLVVPLSPQAVEIFHELKRTTGGSPWVFSADGDSNIAANFGRLGTVLKNATRVTSLPSCWGIKAFPARRRSRARRA